MVLVRISEGHRRGIGGPSPLRSPGGRRGLARGFPGLSPGPRRAFPGSAGCGTASAVGHLGIPEAAFPQMQPFLDRDERRPLSTFCSPDYVA